MGSEAFNSAQKSWFELFRVYLRPRVRTMLFLGFSAGLPYMLVFATLSRWLREAGVERGAIGFISWIMLAYAFKWVWAPFVDRLPIPVLTQGLGRRRSWMLCSQIVIMTALAGMALSDPRYELTALVSLALLAAFASATQDIAIDAYRIEAVEEELQAAMAAAYMIGYRVAMILASAGVLYIAAYFDIDEETYRYSSWMMAYLSMAIMILVGVVTTLVISEPEGTADSGTLERESHVQEIIESFIHIPGFLRRFFDWFYNAVISPFLDFVVRYRWHALLILSLIGTYRISDIVLGVIANVFYVDMGFTKKEVATISNIYGTLMTLLGAILCGVFMVRYGVMRILFLGALLSSATNVLFSIMSATGKSLLMLILVISADNFSAGIATAAFIAYLSSLTNISYTATQYALFSSIMLLLPKFIGGFSGVLVDKIGYEIFFILTAVIGVPVLFLIFLAGKYIPSSGYRKHDR